MLRTFALHVQGLEGEHKSLFINSNTSVKADEAAIYVKKRLVKDRKEWDCAHESNLTVFKEERNKASQNIAQHDETTQGSLSQHSIV